MITDSVMQGADNIGYSVASKQTRNQPYPCGFAWLSIKMRKNGPGSAILKMHGWCWSDYEKRWTLTMSKYTSNQSMDLKEEIAYEIAKYLRQNGVECSVGSRMD